MPWIKNVKKRFLHLCTAKYPRLVHLALKYLGIPATSVPSEILFSKASEIVSRWSTGRPFLSPPSSFLSSPPLPRSTHDLPNGTTFNDLEWPLTPISRSRHFSTLNISEKESHSYWPRLTAKRVEPVVSISWASCLIPETERTTIYRQL